MTDVPPLIARFENCTLSKEEWTHQAHLTVGLWYASRLPYDAALGAVREGIQRLNAAHGLVTTPERGYHETITRFYMRVLCDYVAHQETHSTGEWDERVGRMLRRYGDRKLPLRHYSEERLMSPEARFGWVEPDLQPLGAHSAAERHLARPAQPLDSPALTLGGDGGGVPGLQVD